MLGKLANIFGIEVANFFEGLSVELDEHSRVEGLLPKPQLIANNKSKLQLFYLNKRQVTPPHAIKSAIAAAFKAAGVGKLAYVLDIQLQPKKVDLNLSADKRKALVQDEAGIADKLFVSATQRSISGFFEVTQEQSKISAYKRPRDLEPTQPDKRIQFAKVDTSIRAYENEVKPPDSQLQAGESYTVQRVFLPAHLDTPDVISSRYGEDQINPTLENTLPPLSHELIQSANLEAHVPPTTLSDFNPHMTTPLSQSHPNTPRNPSPSQASKVRLPTPSKAVSVAFDTPTSLNWTLEQLRLAYIKSDFEQVQIPESMNVFNAQCLQPESFEAFFNKEQFSKMRVLGQFNLGFIVVNLIDTPELFLVDQHAADEISQFEMLCETTKLHMQPLVCPIVLKLQPHEEVLVTQHLSLFERFGFKLENDEDKASGEHLRVTALALTKNKLFDVEGIYEAISQLVEHSYVESADSLASLCRPSQFRSVMASRACRSAVMIGTELQAKHMQKIVHHLQDLKRPWNCPHGRPTMLHLSSLSQLQSQKKPASFKNL